MIKILVVDDSALVRKKLTEELSKIPGFEVVGSAVDPYVAREKIIQLNPDVLTLDLEMPRMDGLTFLEQLMRHHPMPVVVVSSLTNNMSAMAVKALSLGAVDVLGKPSRFDTPEVQYKLAAALRAAASARLPKRLGAPNPADAGKPLPLGFSPENFVIALGASSGGISAIESVLKAMPVDAPGIVVAQHIPEGLTASYAEYLKDQCVIQVREAKEGDVLHPGLALISPGNQHIVLRQERSLYVVRLHQDPPVHFQRPSVDVLFESVAQSAGSNAIGCLLTGMGSDGAQGLLAMKKRGALTLAQDAESSVVYGMPKEALRLGAAVESVPLADLPTRILVHVRRHLHNV